MIAKMRYTQWQIFTASEQVEKEIRALPADMKARYVRRVVILHAFLKKTQKTPRRAIDIALRRLEELRL